MGREGDEESLGNCWEGVWREGEREKGCTRGTKMALSWILFNFLMMGKS